MEYIYAIIGSSIAGSFWYHKRVFGGIWMKETGMKEKDMNPKDPAVAKSYLLMNIGTFLQYGVFSYLLSSLRSGDVRDVVFTSILLWLGFIVITQTSDVIWTTKPKWKSFFIHAGYQAVKISIFLLIYLFA